MHLVARDAIRLTLADLIFFRSVLLDGMDLALAARFLPERPPRPSFHLRSIRETLVIAARRHHARSLAALLERAQPAPAAAPSSVPSLEEFAALHHPGVDLSERELLELMAERYPTLGRAQRGQRRREAHRRRLARAINWLGERLIAQPALTPHPADAPGAWLVSALADKIEASGCNSLAQLTSLVAERGTRWHVSVKGIGAGKAARITQWLQQAIPGFEQHVGERALVPLKELRPRLQAARSLQTAVVPFEYFIAPIEIAAAVNPYRRPFPEGGLNARTDREAVNEWFKTKLTAAEWAVSDPHQRAANHTYRAYRREIERLWMWAVLARGKALSALDVDDGIAYENFLMDPQPRALWMGPRRPRWHPEWRPFSRIPSPASRELALVAVQGLFEFWLRRGWVALNPWRDGPKRYASPRPQFREKALSVPDWSHVLNHLRALADGEAQARQKAALVLLYGSGLRRAELAAATIGGLKRGTDDEGLEFWELEVTGKGRRARIVPVIDPAVAALKAYFSYRFGHGELQGAPKAEPLLASLRESEEDGEKKRRALSPWAIGHLVISSLRQAAVDSPATSRLRRASCHSLRHTTATHALQLDPQSLPHISKMLGHADIKMTASNYLTTDSDERRKVANRLATRAKI